jgi:hypothetical protein
MFVSLLFLGGVLLIFFNVLNRGLDLEAVRAMVVNMIVVGESS